jgi:hypothetical protein
MKNIWYVLNIALVTLALPGGYNSLLPEKLGNKNPDVIFCGFILLGGPLFALWSVNYSIRRSNDSKLARPSEQKPSELVARPFTVAVYFYVRRGIHGNRRCPAASHNWFGWVLDGHSLHLLCFRTLDRSDSGLPDVS